MCQAPGESQAPGGTTPIDETSDPANALAARSGAPRYARPRRGFAAYVPAFCSGDFLDRPFDNLMRPLTGVASHAMDACALDASTPPVRRSSTTFVRRVR